MKMITEGSLKKAVGPSDKAASKMKSSGKKLFTKKK